MHQKSGAKEPQNLAHPAVAMVLFGVLQAASTRIYSDYHCQDLLQWQLPTDYPLTPDTPSRLLRLETAYILLVTTESYQVPLTRQSLITSTAT